MQTPLEAFQRPPLSPERLTLAVAYQPLGTARSMCPKSLLFLLYPVDQARRLPQNTGVNQHGQRPPHAGGRGTHHVACADMSCFAPVPSSSVGVLLWVIDAPLPLNRRPKAAHWICFATRLKDGSLGPVRDTERYQDGGRQGRCSCRGQPFGLRHGSRENDGTTGDGAPPPGCPPRRRRCDADAAAARKSTAKSV